MNNLANKIAYISNGILEQLANQVVISQNSIYCLNRKYFNIHDFVTDAYAKPLPQVRINTIQSNYVAGTATPGARVELFSNDEGECAACEPRTFFATVKANAQGNWSYNGVAPGNIVASAIYNNQTSLFTKAMIDVAGLKVKQPKCGDKTGAISGIKYYNAGQIRWINENGEVLNHSTDINNLPPGRYKFKIGSDVCGAESDWIDIVDNSVKINAGNIKTKQPACNKGGAISGIVVSTYQDEKFIAKWMDKNLNQVGNTVDIVNLNPGEYTLEVTGQQTGCTKNYGPVKLLASTGPLIDQTGTKIQSTNCGQSTGSITNIGVTGTGNLKYIWWNSQQQQVGTQKDLANQPAGTYKLQVLDDTQCGPIYTTDITIPETNGITLDESKVTTSIASCSQNNGSIKGISFSGATKFQWMDANNQVVSNTTDFTGAAPGVYTFTASNNFGCTKTSQPYTVGQQPPVQLPQYSVTKVASCFGGQNGSITIATDGLIKTLRWVDGQGSPAGDQPALTNVAAGAYKLYITDQNGCENLYNTYIIDEVPEYKVVSTGQTTNDQCGLNTGSVSNANITGGVPPYTYKWTDATGKQIGAETAISKLAAGNYVLNVTDTRCGNLDIPYTITEESAEVAAPSVSDIQLCSSGGALLSVNNASPDITYRLYETENSAHQIDEQTGGKFNINVTANRSYFVTQLNGTCESARAEVKITVGLSTINIANAFTPNGDGINDYWKISNIESYPGALVQVFSRYGQKVFESRGYAKPFDGTMNGKKLSPGAYYYIINLNTKCNVLSGSLTIIR